MTEKQNFTKEYLEKVKGKILVLEIASQKNYGTIIGKFSDYKEPKHPFEWYQLIFDILLPYERSKLLPLEISLLPINKSLTILRKLPFRKRNSAEHLLEVINNSSPAYGVVRVGTYSLELDKIKSIELAEALRDYIINSLISRLPKDLSYHMVEHTFDVYESARHLAATENLSRYDTELVLIGALFHDTGFTKGYKAHESHSTAFASETLQKFGYSPEEINTVGKMILATEIPQNPQTDIEKALCDADMDILGREDFLRKSGLLRKEWEMFLHKIYTDEEWYKHEIDFLENHRYFTNSANIQRGEGKAKNIEKLKKALSES